MLAPHFNEQQPSFQELEDLDSFVFDIELVLLQAGYASSPEAKPLSSTDSSNSIPSIEPFSLDESINNESETIENTKPIKKSLSNLGDAYSSNGNETLTPASEDSIVLSPSPKSPLLPLSSQQHQHIDTSSSFEDNFVVHPSCPHEIHSHASLLSSSSASSHSHQNGFTPIKIVHFDGTYYWLSNGKKMEYPCKKKLCNSILYPEPCENHYICCQLPKNIENLVIRCTSCGTASHICPECLEPLWIRYQKKKKYSTDMMPDFCDHMNTAHGYNLEVSESKSKSKKKQKTANASSTAISIAHASDIASSILSVAAPLFSSISSTTMVESDECRKRDRDDEKSLVDDGIFMNDASIQEDNITIGDSDGNEEANSSEYRKNT